MTIRIVSHDLYDRLNYANILHLIIYVLVKKIGRIVKLRKNTQNNIINVGEIPTKY